jgi:hypothetical protein
MIQSATDYLDMIYNPVINGFEWIPETHELLVFFVENGWPVFLYTPLVHDRWTNDVVIYDRQKGAGYVHLQPNPKIVKYTKGNINPYKHPEKVLHTKQFIRLDDRTDVYPLGYHNLMVPELLEQLQSH